jgi:hypothetical protein
MRPLFKEKARECGIILDDEYSVLHIRKENFEKYTEIIWELGRSQEAAMWKLQQWNEQDL